MQKKIIGIAAAILLLFAAWYFIGSGLQKQGNAYISDFTVSEDGTEMIVRMGVASSVGYIRKVAVQQQDDMLILTPYAAFGGINGRIGAKREFTVSLAADTETVALYRARNAYAPVLVRDANGTWQYRD